MKQRLIDAAWSALNAYCHACETIGIKRPPFEMRLLDLIDRFDEDTREVHEWFRAIDRDLVKQALAERECGVNTLVVGGIN